MVDERLALPLVLAGPILRRIEPKKLTLWLVCTQPCDIRLDIGPADHPIAIKKQKISSLSGGSHLHFCLVQAEFDDDLPFDCQIPYQLCLKTKQESEENWQDLSTLSSGLTYPDQDSLSFRLPSHVASVLHGSCRKPHHDSGDGLVQADELLQKLLTTEPEPDKDLPAWPSFLVMSGDQIYADDVAGPLLRAIHSVIERLDLPSEDFQQLNAPNLTDSNSLYSHEKTYFGRTELLPETEKTRDLLDILFGGVRKPVFTTDTAHNHLISLHENLIMYLMVWSPIPWEIACMDTPAHLDGSDKFLYEKERAILERFVKTLGQVRRLFAHIPVAMIFDDHDITDDWNLNRQWEETVYGHPFSKRMVANSLSAYFICQGWGNNPDGFDAAFLEKLQEALDRPGEKAHDAFMDQILGFEGWEYDWPSQPPLIVMDSRTRRWRSESSMVKPSGLLDWEAIGDLQQKLYGNDSVLLVSPAPIYGVKLIENIQRIFTWFGKPLLVDAENWMAHPGTANSILNVFLHSKTPQNFVILSGDVHYSFVYDVELRGRKGGPDIWQVTSSGFKNEFPKRLLDILDIANRWLYSPRSPLNWFTKRKRMRIIPRKPEGHADGRRLLNGAGVGLVELDKNGAPTRFRQLLADGRVVGYERMERHSRWQ